MVVCLHAYNLTQYGECYRVFIWMCVRDLCLFFFFQQVWTITHTIHAHRFIMQETKYTVYILFTHCLRDPQPLYSEKKIKNGSYGTIHIFKNYFIIMFLVFSKISCIQTDLKKGSNKRWIGAKNYIVSYWLHYWKYLFHLPSD